MLFDVSYCSYDYLPSMDYQTFQRCTAMRSAHPYMSQGRIIVEDSVFSFSLREFSVSDSKHFQFVFLNPKYLPGFCSWHLHFKSQRTREVEIR